MKRPAFSLIEILFTLAIIGIVASISLSITNSVRLKARDAHRKTDLQSVKIAMVLYKNTNSNYPKFDHALCTANAGAVALNTAWTNLATSLAPFVNTVPLDPLVKRDGSGNCPTTTDAWETQPATLHGYTFFGNAAVGNGWSIWSTLENKRDADRNGARAHDYASAAAAMASNGLFKSVYFYGTMESIAFGLANANDTSDLIYGVGCRVVGGGCVDN